MGARLVGFAVMTARPVALTIAGSDSSGGAGIAADLKTFEALGVWGTAALTAVTAQGSEGVRASIVLAPELVRAQIEVIAGDLGVNAAKTGTLGSAEVVLAVAEAVRAGRIQPLVVDPVLAASRGGRLLAADALVPLRQGLFPLTTVLTPNLAEASALTGIDVADREGMVAAAKALHRLGPAVVVVKGGHLADRDRSPDLVWTDDGAQWLEGPRIETVHTHGTGCVFSAAIAAGLARGREPVDACVAAKRFVQVAIEGGFELGGSAGPVDPGWSRSR